QRAQRVAEGRQRVFDPWRYFRVDLAVHDAVALQLAQVLRQHPLADARDAPPQGGEAVRPLLEPAQDDRLPLAAARVQGPLDRRVVLPPGRLRPRPGRHAYFPVRIALRPAYLSPPQGLSYHLVSGEPASARRAAVGRKPSDRRLRDEGVSMNIGIIGAG